MAAEPQICDVGQKGIFLPLAGDTEQNGDKRLRGALYLVALGYMFVAVNIAADYFMSAVETIVSSKRRIRNPATGQLVTVLTWNGTVANLSLLALGSSAPEILLSCVEMFGQDFHAGDLGPSTIVGSAAFNLLVIISVCVYAIPAGEVRAIKEMPAYHVTVCFSIFAYVWLLAIVSWITPGVVDLWEALVTLVMFPILVAVAFWADKGHMDCLALEPPVNDDSIELVSSGDNATEQTSTKSQVGRTSLAHANLHPRARASKASRMSLHAVPQQRGLENDSAFSEQLEATAEHVATAGTARAAGEDSHGNIEDPVTGQVINNPQGVITFLEDAMEVPGASTAKVLNVDIFRRNGTKGKISCTYRTEGLNAVPGHDFKEANGLLEFEDGETKHSVDLEVLPQRPTENHDHFQLVLEALSGSAQFNPNDDGGKEHAVLTVKIVNTGHTAGCLSQLSENCIDWDNLSLGLSLWWEQIIDSFSVEDDDDDDEIEDRQADAESETSGPSVLDYVLHIFMLPWKVAFAVVAPPPNICGGWCLFWLSLAYIAILIAVVWDLASLLGCCLNMDDELTAITIVALGTSLPDMLASRTSATNDETADASIVNVTGSNSVNVFLGIGIPWTCSAIYWNADDDVFRVEAGNLGFSVMVFNCVAIIALVVLRMRRVKFGGELGGPVAGKTASSALLLILWLCYIGASVWRLSSEDAELLTGPLMALAFVVLVAGVIYECWLRASGLAATPGVHPGISDDSPSGTTNGDGAISPTNSTVGILKGKGSPMSPGPSTVGKTQSKWGNCKAPGSEGCKRSTATLNSSIQVDPGKIGPGGRALSTWNAALGKDGKALERE